MATWEDGPEYAPHERPQYFADAPVPPLEQAPPPTRPADGMPTTRPLFPEPDAPVAPLETLVPEPPDERDPSRPFDVVTATMTTESAWVSAPLVPAAPLVARTAPAAPLGPVPRVAGPTPVPAPWPVLEPPSGQAGFPPTSVEAPPP